MKIYVTSLIVDDQEKALQFYTQILGFRLKQDFPVGEYRWLTLVSPEQPDGVELLLEPDVHPAAKAFKAAIKADGIAYTSFQVNDLEAEYQRLLALGVVFTQAPMLAGNVKIAVLEDGCGNLIQLMQPLPESS